MGATQGAVVLLLVASITGLVVSNVLISREQRRTSANLQLARKAVEEYLTKVSMSRLLNEPGLQPLRRELLESALRYYQSLVGQQAGDRGLRFDLGMAQLRVGAIQDLLGEKAKALAAYRNALEIHRGLVAAAPANPLFQGSLEETYDRVGGLELAFGDLPAARRHHEQAVAISDRLATVEPENEVFQRRRAMRRVNLSASLQESGDHSAAEGPLREAIAIEGRLVAVNPGDITHRARLADYNQRLAVLLVLQGRLAEAEKAMSGTIAALEAATTSERRSDDDRFALAEGLASLGQLQRRMGHAKDARRSYLQVADLLEGLAAANPSVMKYRVGLAATATNLVTEPHEIAGMKPGEIEEVLRAGKRATVLFTGLSAAEPGVPVHLRGMAIAWSNLGRFQAGIKDRQGGIASLQRAIVVGERLVRFFPMDREGQGVLANAYLSLAEYQRLHDEAAARESYERCLYLTERLIALDPKAEDYDELLGAARFRISMMDLEAKRYDEAERAVRRNLETGEAGLRAKPDLALLPPHMTRLARFGSGHRDVGRVLEARGKLEEAITWYDRAIPILADAIRRQPQDHNAPLWLADTREMRSRALAKLAADAAVHARGVPLPPTTAFSMPNGLDSFARPSCPLP